MEKDTFKQRRQMLADMILNNELYVPMKAKEIVIEKHSYASRYS